MGFFSPVQICGATSDDAVIERWAQDVYFQFFSGQEYFEARFPCDKAQLSRFRKGLGEAGVEELLKTTIEASVAMGAVKKADLQRVIVDTTVQEKAIAHPTGSRLLEVARAKIVRLAQRAGIKLKLTHKQGLIVGARTFPGNGNLRLAQAAG
jgi:IS5 family transposase